MISSLIQSKDRENITCNGVQETTTVNPGHATIFMGILNWYIENSELFFDLYENVVDF